MQNENMPTEVQDSDKLEAESALRGAACYTIFYDMSSGGSEKESFTKLAVKLSESEAVEWFEKTFGRDPHNVTCQCCGADYAVYEQKDTDRADVVVDDPSGYNDQVEARQ